MYRVRRNTKALFWFASVLGLAGIIALAACEQHSQNLDERSGFPVVNSNDCLPDITLVDQNGQNVPLASLKGKPVLVDFIYTSCPGPCLVLTSRMKAVADHLGAAPGKDVSLVSITVDPDHDHPKQLRDYAMIQGANVNGWLFLTGPPKKIDDTLGHFRLIRHRETDGTVDHVLEFFLVGADGHALLEYLGEKADPDRIAEDATRAAAGKPVFAGDGSRVEVRLPSGAT
jgi:protein SCO1